MNKAVRMRWGEVAVTALAGCGYLGLSLTHGFVGEPLMALLPLLPFAALAAIVLRTRSERLRGWALILMVLFAAAGAGQTVYALLRHDHWLMMNLAILGAWETVIVSIVVGLAGLLRAKRR